MEKGTFSEEIVNLYQFIQNQTDKVRLNSLEEGYINKKRINYEYLNLDDIFDLLIEVLPLIIDLYKDKRFKHIQKEMYCVFIAALCEISKRGFSQGGILKQIEEYIGYSFNKYRYYELIKLAIKSEGILLIDNKKRYLEETIVYESGIPKKFHRDLYSFFKLYWKWLRGIDSEERRDFLRAFVENSIIHEQYIADINDFNKMSTLRNSMSDFQEKVIKTCIRIDKIYSEIDKIQEDINETNINNVCKKISEHLGYNILTVINEGALTNDLISSAHCISFKKFQYIINNLAPDEKIKLPIGCYTSNQDYNITKFIAGYHVVRNITYEVIFPYGLKCYDYFSLPRNEVIKRNDHYIYLSEDPFLVVIDGYEIEIREMVWKNELLYVFAGKIPAASSANIDDNLINCDKAIKLKASIRKSWDRLLKQNKLIICLDEFKIFNPEFAMQPVVIKCNVTESQIVKQINQYGHLRIIEKWMEIINFNDNVIIEASINGVVVEKKIISINEMYIYSLQTGMRIDSKIEWQKWYSDNRIVIFSKLPIEISNIELQFQNMFYDMYVYIGKINFDGNNIVLNKNEILIEESNNPLIKLTSKVFESNSGLFVPAGVPIQFSAINCTENNMFLKISHGESRYIGKHLSELDCLDNFTLLDCGIYSKSNYGRWYVSLYKEQIKVSEITYFVLSEVEAKLDKEIYEDGAKVLASITALDNCFIVDGDATNECTVGIGNAKIEVCGNYVGAEEIEFEVIDSSCDFPYRFKLRPEVWGIKKQKNNEWIDCKEKKLSFELSTKDDISLIVCSTKNQGILIHSNELELYRNIKPGFNKISWRTLINNWKRVNEFKIFNTIMEMIPFQVVYNPTSVIKHYEYTRNALIIHVGFFGPIGTQISIVAFANDVKISKIVRHAIYNKNDFILKIENISDYEGQELVVQVRHDDESPEIVFKNDIYYPVESSVENYNNTEEHQEKMHESDKHILLSQYVNTCKILNVKPSNLCKSISAIDILKHLRGSF